MPKRSARRRCGICTICARWITPASSMGSTSRTDSDLHDGLAHERLAATRIECDKWRRVMANIVLGLATTHSPNVSTPVELWHLRGENDPNIVGRETFDRLLQQNSTWASEEITSDKWQERYDQIQRAIAELAQTFAEVQPEVVVTVGDDQRELFADSHRPAIDIYLGESARDVPPEPNSLNEL